MENTYFTKEAIELFRTSIGDIENQVKHRLGYAESDNKDEVLKGARIASAIIEDNMLHILSSMLSTIEFDKSQREYHEAQRKQLAVAMKYVMSAIED